MLSRFARSYSSLRQQLLERTLFAFMSSKRGETNLTFSMKDPQMKSFCNGLHLYACKSEENEGQPNSSNGHTGASSIDVGIKNRTIKREVDLEKFSEEEKEIYALHKTACEEGKSMYVDPATGYAVFTEISHLQRGSCCGNACRHCPYNHENVPLNKRTKNFNSAFYF